MLPLLTVLFLISYGLMVLLVIEQNRTITSTALAYHRADVGPKRIDVAKRQVAERKA